MICIASIPVKYPQISRIHMIFIKISRIPIAPLKGPHVSRESALRDGNEKRLQLEQVILTQFFADVTEDDFGLHEYLTINIEHWQLTGRAYSSLNELIHKLKYNNSIFLFKNLNLSSTNKQTNKRSNRI